MHALSAVLLALLLVPTARAAADPPEGGDAPHARRHAALFVGQARTAGHTALAIGGDVSWRLHALGGRLSAGVFGDAALGHDKHAVAGVAVTAHPGAGFRVTVAPALAVDDGHRDLVLRLGAGYDVTLGAVSFTPIVHLDTAARYTSVGGGVAFGVAF